MDASTVGAGRAGGIDALKLLLFLLGCGGPCFQIAAPAQERGSLTGESAAEALKESAQAEAQQYNMHYGPLDFQAGARLRFGYTDNVFYSDTGRKDDFVISPEADLAAFMQISELNTLKLSLGLGYEYYVKNTVLNGDAPLVNPGSELAFNVFVGDVRIRVHEKFSYQQTLFINTTPNGQDLLFNFNNVGTFTRWDNVAGLNVDWDLDKVILSVGYDHENFSSSTAGFEYLDRASEWFNGSVSFLIGDQTKVGVESQAGLHDYDSEAVLNDHWQARVGPFVESKLPGGITLRTGGGYDTAWYDSAGASSDYKTYYVYGRLTQETRFFSHGLSAGRETLLGENANNLEDTYIRYSISSPVFEHVQLEANASAHFDEESGGAFQENFDYYVAGLSVGYQIHKYWRIQAGYEFMLKHSDLPLRNFTRNMATLSASFTF